MIVLYGIPNCSTVRAARAWLAERGVQYLFHDYKKQGADAARLRAWVDEVGWEPLLNRRGLAWRKLPETARAGTLDAERAIALMAATPSLIRRPLLEIDGRVRHLGFAADDYAALFGQEPFNDNRSILAPLPIVGE